MKRGLQTAVIGVVALLGACRPQAVNVAKLAAGVPATISSRQAGATELSILFGGDTYFGESYPVAPDVLREKGYRWMLDGLRPLLNAADWSVLNLETPVTRLTNSPLFGRKEFVHRAEAEQTPSVLAAYGVRVVCLANNHAFDYGEAGMAETIQLFNERGVESFGAGTNFVEAVRPWLGEFTLDGHRQVVAVVGGLEYYRTFERQGGRYATAERGGVARLDAKLLSSLIAELRRRHPGIFIIAFPHWGWNYDWKSARQEQEAKNLLAAGVDLVLGHSAHRMQEVERVEGRWVVYSLGNFVFGSPGRYAELHSPPFSLVAILMFRVVDRQVQPLLKLYPILSDNLQTGYRPRLVNKTEFTDVVQLLRQRSPSRNLMQTGVDNLGPHLRLELR